MKGDFHFAVRGALRAPKGVKFATGLNIEMRLLLARLWRSRVATSRCWQHQVTAPLPSAGTLRSMTFRKPFRAVPIRPAGRYRSKPKKLKVRSLATLFGGAAFAGLMFGTASAGAFPSWVAMQEAVKPLAVSVGLIRAREPQPGDFWPGCDAARTAGTAPIYAGEPGYRDEMDRDGDGIACEPYRGV